MRLCAKADCECPLYKIPIVFDVCAANTIGIFLDK